MGQPDNPVAKNSNVTHGESANLQHNDSDSHKTSTEVLDKVIDTIPYTALILGVAGAIFLGLLVVKLWVKNRKNTKSKEGKVEKGHDNPGLVVEQQPPTYEETIEGRPHGLASIFGRNGGADNPNMAEPTNATLTNVTVRQSERF